MNFIRGVENKFNLILNQQQVKTKKKLNSSIGSNASDISFSKLMFDEKITPDCKEMNILDKSD
jgi:hypothetical protein